ncbi:MAG: amidohydrolase [Pseudonocardia sp.]|uniref:amidohydrolase family protein n=1 Tax=unclassified Pseudonocardia TaxID=2619320 RepID=UPI000869F11E|nr:MULTISPECIES: amidohydrolase family protein [unclassified Pseudonocardia]MBN9112458.1 amidohydrolase [Pseudonocardia sp.]ODU27369.1 MAG: amidohydrolase [Pseudonocardia sp. SCN 72-51]ODV09013.1 MAG: amidohydrolase [Pseudonocardia sp. SCN 73-27]
MSERTLPKIISVDDHVVEPPHLFERWLPKRFLDRAPRVERRWIDMETDAYNDTEVAEGEGLPADVWVYGDSMYVPRRPVLILKDVETSAAMRDKEPVTYDEMDPACYVPAERLKAMDSQHVEASLGFPSFPRFCGQAFSEQYRDDRELGLACVRAYNDWMVEEWCGDSGGRLIPAQVVPLWDAQLAADEVRRNAARGVRAVTFSEIVGHLGFATIHDRNWDPFFAACEETGTVVCMHIGSASLMMQPPPGSPTVVVPILQFANSYASMADFVFSGVLDRFPQLKLAYSEGQAGWMPYAMERMDHAYRHHTWALGEQRIEELPSTYVRRNMYGCVFADRHAISHAREIGTDNLMFEVDFPHADGPYPNTYAHLERQFEGIDDEITYKIIRGNAIRVFELGFDRELAGAPTGDVPVTA